MLKISGTLTFMRVGKLSSRTSSTLFMAKRETWSGHPRGRRNRRAGFILMDEGKMVSGPTTCPNLRITRCEMISSKNWERRFSSRTMRMPRRWAKNGWARGGRGRPGLLTLGPASAEASFRRARYCMDCREWPPASATDGVPAGNPCGCGNYGCLEKHASLLPPSVAMAGMLQLGARTCREGSPRHAKAGDDQARTRILDHGRRC